MRFVDVIFHIGNLTHTPFGLRVSTVHATSTMAPPKARKSKPAESEGEEFSDLDNSNINSSDEEVEIGADTLTWVCPTVGPLAKRGEFKAVGASGQVLYSKQYKFTIFYVIRCLRRLNSKLASSK